MPPKFQSSFIPKGPIATGSSAMPVSSPRRYDLLAILAKAIFGFSFLLALAATGYKFYLNYSLEKMAVEIEQARQELAQGSASELVSLNDRLSSTSNLLESHRVASPLLAFLETNTPRTVRFTEFSFEATDKGLDLSLRGEAQSYAALALQSEIIHKNKNFKNPSFSEIRLDDEGNVTFLLKLVVSPELLSYTKQVARVDLPVASSTLSTATTTTATTTAKTATTTSATSTNSTTKKP